MHHVDAARRQPSRAAASVLLAIDNQADALETTAWAAAEASARQASLRLLHVVPWDPFEPVPVAPGDHGVHEAAHRLLDRAAQRARQVAPHLVVSTAIHIGDPARAIALAGDDTDLIVLGRDATCRPQRRRGRSVILQVATRSRCPVAVVGLSGQATYGRGPGARRTSRTKRTIRW